MKTMSRFRLAALVAVAICSVSAKPVAWWASYPVKPGEHVLVSGGGWSKSVQVKLNGRVLEPTTVSETGVTFEWPAEMTDPRPSVVLEDGTGASEPIVLNAPTVWWMQGDDFDSSSPGSTVRLFGRSLKGAEVKVRGEGQERTLETVQDDDYSLTAKIPSDLPAGTYAVKLSIRTSTSTRDFDSSLAWKVAEKPDFWTTNVFRVVDFGAVPDDGRDDDRAVHAAIDAAKAAGGGTILFPRGRIEVHSKLVLPPHVRLKGVSRDVSGLFWQDFFNPPDILVSGEHSFGVEDLFLTCGLCRQGIRPTAIPTHDVYLKRLRLRFITDQWRDSETSAEYRDFLRRYNMPGPGIHVYRGSRVWLEDVDMYWDKNSPGAMTVGPRMEINATDVVMRNCSSRGSGFCRFSIRRALVEDNEFETTTVSIVPATRDLFWSRNRHLDRYAGDREAITQDLRSNAYVNYQPSGVVDGVNVRMSVPADVGYSFAFGTNPGWNRLEEWTDANIQVVAGRGLGQVRRIVRPVSKTEYVIDRPFDLAPDETSRFSVRFVRQHLHYVDNEMRDAHVAVQLYGGASDCIVARNKSLFAGGFIGHGIDNKGGVMPCFDCQFLDNEIVSPLEAYRAFATPALVGHPGKTAWKHPRHLARGFVLRGNVIEGGALALGCPDGIAEGNVVRHSAVGLVEAGFAESHVIGRNTFEDVAKEKATSWALGGSNYFENKLDWTAGTDAATKYATLETAFRVSEGEPVALRYWCDDNKATATFDGVVVQSPDMDRRQRKTYLFGPGTHVVRVVFSGDAKASQGKKFHFDLLGEADAKRIEKTPVPKRVLLVSKVYGYNHKDGIAKGDAALKATAVANGDFTVETAEDFAALTNPGFLDRFDAIVLNNTTAVKTKAFPGLEEALTAFVRGGKGLCLIHSAVDAFYDSEAMQEMNGGLFFGHPWHYQGTWRFVNELPDDPLNASFKGVKEFSFGDEIYMQKSPPYDRSKCKVLVSLSKTDAANRAAADAWRNNPKVAQRFPLRDDGDFAVSWTKPYGQGRVFYTSFGHDGRAFADKGIYGHILAGLRYCLGR